MKFIQKIIQINRVTKVVKGGKNLSFQSLIVIGNLDGTVGMGLGKAKTVSESLKNALKNAQNNLFTIKINKQKSLPFLVKNKFLSSLIILKPANLGTGVIAGGATRAILEVAGIENILTKQYGSSNLINSTYATIAALKTYSI